LIGIDPRLHANRYHCLLHETWDHAPNRALTHHWAFRPTSTAPPNWRIFKSKQSSFYVCN